MAEGAPPDVFSSPYSVIGDPSQAVQAEEVESAASEAAGVWRVMAVSVPAQDSHEVAHDHSRMEGPVILKRKTFLLY